MFEAEDVEGIVDKFDVPLPVYCEGNLILRATREDVVKSIGNLMQAVKTSGAVTVVPRIVSVRPSKKLCASVARVEWRYLDADDGIVSSSEINYYCGANAQREMKIVMVEYLRVGVPQAIRSFLDANTPKQVN